MLSTFAGIDYGSKTSGNTVVCHHDGTAVYFYEADKKDADLFIIDWITKYKSVQNRPALTTIFLDAPLSLPAVYQSIVGFSNYHYRQCDVALKAMSPMFLGGLTARAIELKQHLQKKMNVETHEVYPKALAQTLLSDHYHKKLTTNEMESLCGMLSKVIPELCLAEYPKTQHQFDALLAWVSGYRFMNQQHLVFGDIQEGIIIV
jgi:predicted nuclease with RNAse H fold